MELPPFASKSLSAIMRFCRISMKTRFPLNEQVAPVKRKVVKSILGVNLVRFWRLLIDPDADNHFLSRKIRTRGPKIKMILVHFEGRYGREINAVAYFRFATALLSSFTSRF